MHPQFSALAGLNLVGKVIVGVQRYGKVLIFQTTGGIDISVQLGMSGRFAVRSFGRMHDQFGFDLGHDCYLTYNDFRRFGRVTVESDAYEYWRRNLGPDALSREFHHETLATLSKRSIKSALIDQKTVAGLGNIYACEALFQAGIHPARPAGSLSATERLKLVRTTKETLRKAIKHGGATLEDYRGTEGEAGDFEKHFGVYARTDEPCRKCGAKSRIARIIVGNRTTYFCARCQH